MDAGTSTNFDLSTYADTGAVSADADSHTAMSGVPAEVEDISVGLE